MSAVLPLKPHERFEVFEKLNQTDGALALDALRRLRAGVIVCNAAGTVRLANPTAEEVLGCRPLEGTPIEAVLAAPDALRHQARHPELSSELRLTGSEQVLGYKVSEGINGELIIIFRDITRQVRMREERDRLMQLSTVGDVLPAVLHELRNPLAAVTSAIEVLVDTARHEDPIELTEALASILNELRRMSLVFQGIGSVGRRLRSQRVSRLDSATREVVRVMVHRAMPAGIAVTCDIAEVPPLALDPAIFKAIVFNLLSNAINACRRGATVTVILRHDDDVISLAVQDDGSGMTPEVLAACTQPFYTTRANGSGLGLVICKEAVEEAGGLLTIISEPGCGTAVWVTVPFESPDDDPIGG